MHVQQQQFKVICILLNLQLGLVNRKLYPRVNSVFKLLAHVDLSRKGLFTVAFTNIGASLV